MAAECFSFSLGASAPDAFPFVSEGVIEARAFDRTLAAGVERKSDLLAFLPCGTAVGKPQVRVVSSAVGLVSPRGVRHDLSFDGHTSSSHGTHSR